MIDERVFVFINLTASVILSFASPASKNHIGLCPRAWPLSLRKNYNPLYKFVKGNIRRLPWQLGVQLYPRFGQLLLPL